MSKNKILFIVLLTVLTTIVVFFVIIKKGGILVSPTLKRIESIQSSIAPSASSYNPPQEIKYDGDTDLKKELNNVNPQVLDSDF